MSIYLITFVFFEQVSLRSHRCHGTTHSESFAFAQLSEKMNSPQDNRQLISTSNPSSPSIPPPPAYQQQTSVLSPSILSSFSELGPGSSSATTSFMFSEINTNGINLDSFVLLEADRLLGLRIDDTDNVWLLRPCKKLPFIFIYWLPRPVCQTFYPWFILCTESSWSGVRQRKCGKSHHFVIFNLIDASRWNSQVEIQALKLMDPSFSVLELLL